MRKNTVVVSTFFVALLLVFTAGVFGVARAAGPITVRAEKATATPIAAIRSHEQSGSKAERVLESAPVATEFSFNGLLASWPTTLDITEENGARLELRLLRFGSWGAWMPLSPLHDAPANAVFPENRGFSEPFFTVSSDGFQYRLVGTEPKDALNDFLGIHITYINSETPREGPITWLRKLFSPFRALAEGGVPVATRADWGADENYRFSGSRELWTPSHAQVEKFILHHTAGSDGGSDPSAVVRGIYYYHAVVLGWGDIGYNYLVDPAGRIYEGRYGGDGVVAGHTYNDQEGIDYNRGTIGIAFLGNFQGDVLTPAASSSATSLIGEKGRLFGIQPAGTGTFRNRVDLPNVIGHRDVDATTCPGNNIFSSFDALRTQAQAAYDALPALPIPVMTAENQTTSPIPVSLQSGERTNLDLVFRNTSNSPWQSYIPSRRVTLRPVVTPSKLGAQGWQTESVVGYSQTANVAQQELATFTLPITAPADVFLVDEVFALFGPDGIELPNTRVTVNVVVRNLPYAGTIESLPIPPATFVKDTRTVTVTIRNQGVTAWQPNDILLRVYDLNDRPSVFRASGWRDAVASLPVTDTVQPGATTNMTLTLRAPASPGTYINIVRMERANGERVPSAERSVVTRADSHWQATFLSKSLPLAVLKAWRPTLTVKFKNTGVATWDRKVKMRVYDAGFRSSAFRDATWGNAVGTATLKEKSVKPGQTGTFVIRIKPPQRRGLYRQVLRLERPGTSTIIQNGLADFLTRVD